MPIANCFTTLAVSQDRADEIVRAWAGNSGIPSDEMTLNVMSGTQGGKRYAAMAWLYLPTLWSAGDAESLTIGLARSLAGVLDLPSDQVLVVRTGVESGSVVEDGMITRW